MSGISTQPALGLRETIKAAADAWELFVEARTAMNAAVPDLMTGTPAERALYDERYKADHEAEREHWSTAIKLAQSAPDILSAWNTRPAPDREARLEAALDDLQQAECKYRLMHDRHGDGSRAAGRAWDLMRRAGDKARAALGDRS